MPDRIYMPADMLRLTLRDRVLSHWHAFIGNAAGVVLGVLIVAGAFHESFDPAPSLAELPGWQAVLVGACLAVGGGLWCFASSRRFEYLEDFWLWQRMGLRLSILGWSAYSVCAVLAHRGWVVPWWLGLCFAVMHIGDLYLSRLHQKRTRGLDLGERHHPRD